MLPPRRLCVLAGPRLPGARLPQLGASGHTAAATKWVRRHKDNIKRLSNIDARREVQATHMTQHAELRPKLATAPEKPSGTRGAASSTAAAPQAPELQRAETTGMAAL